MDLEDIDDENLRDKVEKGLERTGVDWSQLSEGQKKKILGGGKKSQKIYRKYSS